MAIKMQIRRGTLAAWAAANNPVLEPGELGFVTDVGKTAFKIGNTAGTGWDTLPYVNSTYPELDVSAGNNLNTSLAQGRYPLLSGSAYTNVPGDFTNTTTDGSSILLVTVPTNNIIIQELTTSLTPCKRWIRAYNGTPAVWTAWKRIDTLSATESLSITNLTLSGALTATGQITTLGSMGVGTASPQQKLDVNGNITSNRTDAGTFTVSGDGVFTFGTDSKQYIYGTSGNAGTIAIYTSNAGGTSANTLVVTSGQVSANGIFNATGINAAASGLTSSNGLTVNSGTTSLTVPLVLGTAAGAGTTVFSTKNTSANVVTTIRGDGVPTAGTDLTTKSYVDAQIVSVIVDTNAWVVTTTIPGGTTDYTINISSQTLGVEYVYYWSQGTYTNTGGSRFANLKVTTNAGIYAQYKSGYRHSDGTVGTNAANFEYSESPNYGGYVFQPSLTYTVANITIGQTNFGQAPNVCWGYITIKRIA